MSKWLINRLHCCSLPRQSQQDLTNAEPPQFSLLGQEAEVPGAPHPSTASSSVQSSRGFKGRKQIPVFETSAPGGPRYCSLTSMGGGGQNFFCSFNPGLLGFSSLSCPLCLKSGIGKSWFSARPPPAYHLPQRSRRGSK